MKFYPKLSLRCKFEIVEVGDDVSAVSVGGGKNDYNGVIMLKNESTRFLFEKVCEGITFPELIKACSDKYTESTTEEIRAQVVLFLNKLNEERLLVEDKKQGITVEEEI